MAIGTVSFRQRKRSFSPWSAQLARSVGRTPFCGLGGAGAPAFGGTFKGAFGGPIGGPPGTVPGTDGKFPNVGAVGGPVVGTPGGAGGLKLNENDGCGPCAKAAN